MTAALRKYIPQGDIDFLTSDNKINKSRKEAAQFIKSHQFINDKFEDFAIMLAYSNWQLLGVLLGEVLKAEEISKQIHREELKLKSDIGHLGEVMDLTLDDISEITFTIKGRKYKTKHPQIKMGLIESIDGILNEERSHPGKQITKPTSRSTRAIKALAPLARFIKNEFEVTNTIVYNVIQDVLTLNHIEVDTDFIRQRLYRLLN